MYMIVSVAGENTNTEMGDGPVRKDQRLPRR
jgi:hypothetical protein